MNKIRLRPYGLSIAIVVCLCGLAGCASVSINTGSAATPPVITWNVTDRSTNILQQYTGNTTLSVKHGSSYYITMHADSPSGVQSATIQPGESWTCEDTSGDGSNRYADIAPQTVTQSAHSGMAEDDLFIFQAITLNMDCISGFTFSSGDFSIGGSATNFASMKISASLTMNVTP